MNIEHIILALLEIKRLQNLKTIEQNRESESLPARSPDLTPIDYFLWGTLKDTVCKESPTTRDDTKQRIIVTCASIRFAIIQNETKLVPVQHCVDVNGLHLKHIKKK